MRVRQQQILDLASGYPTLPISGFFSSLKTQATAEVLHALSANAHKTYKSEIGLAEAALLTRLAFVLGLDSKQHSLQTAITGSIAISRILTALIELSRDRGKSGVHLITASPFFDLPILLADEIRGFRRSTVFRNLPEGRLPFDKLREVLNTTRIDEMAVILVASPDNPTGSVWSAREISSLRAICASTNAILFVDHCFLLAGVQTPFSVPAVWECCEDNCEWVSIWDTGKTLALGGEKIAVTISNSKELNKKIKQALEVVQFELPLNTLLLFSKIFADEHWKDEVHRLHEVCVRNYNRLSRTNLGQCCIYKPEGSTLVLVELRNKHEKGASEVFEGNGVGVISGRPFFCPGHNSPALIRISLARDDDYFCEALEKLTVALKDC